MLSTGLLCVYNTGMFDLKTSEKFYYYTHT